MIHKAFRTITAWAGFAAGIAADAAFRFFLEEGIAGFNILVFKVFDFLGDWIKRPVRDRITNDDIGRNRVAVQTALTALMEQFKAVEAVYTSRGGVNGHEGLALFNRRDMLTCLFNNLPPVDDPPLAGNTDQV